MCFCYDKWLRVAVLAMMENGEKSVLGLHWLQQLAKVYPARYAKTSWNSYSFTK